MRISTLNIYMRKVFNIVHRSCCFFVDLPRIAFHLHLWVKAEKRICRWTSFIAATLEMPPRSFPRVGSYQCLKTAFSVDSDVSWLLLKFDSGRGASFALLWSKTHPLSRPPPNPSSFFPAGCTHCPALAAVAANNNPFW